MSLGNGHAFFVAIARVCARTGRGISGLRRHMFLEWILTTEFERHGEAYDFRMVNARTRRVDFQKTLALFRHLRWDILLARAPGLAIPFALSVIAKPRALGRWASGEEAN